MRQEMSISANHARHGLALALLTSMIVMLGAGSARANNDFQNGFEDQLGRIVANTAVAIGLGGYPVVAAPVYYTPPPVYYAPPPVYYAPPVVVVPPPVYYAPPVYYGPGYGAYYAPPRKVKVKHVYHGGYYGGHPGRGRGHYKGY